MVSMKKLGIITFMIVAFGTLLVTGWCSAADKPTVTETYKVTINDVGDGHIVDTIKYSKDDYATIKKVQNKKRGFLTRRYTSEDTTGEVVGFNTDMDDATHSVIITYDKPGMAYNEKGEWILYGYSTKPKEDSGLTYTFEETSTINSEFTLFTDQVFKTTSEVTLPASATGANYVAADKALKYQMPPARTLYGFWAEQKAALSVTFGLLTLVFAGLLVFVWTRKETVVPVAAVVPGTVAGVTPPHDALSHDEAGAAQPEKGQHQFCQHCGSKIVSGKGFCTNCGSKVD
jgi:hypothetical protein